MFEPRYQNSWKQTGREFWQPSLLVQRRLPAGLEQLSPKAVSESPIPPSTHERMHLTPRNLQSPPPHKAIHAVSPPCPAPAAQRIFGPQYLYHRAEGKDVDKKFCFICQVIVNGAEPAFAVLVIFRVRFHSWQSGACTAPGSCARR